MEKINQTESYFFEVIIKIDTDKRQKKKFPISSMKEEYLCRSFRH